MRFEKNGMTNQFQITPMEDVEFFILLERVR